MMASSFSLLTPAAAAATAAPRGKQWEDVLGDVRQPCQPSRWNPLG